MAMRDLLYFNPDPEVPDADLLGIGDLIYSDGSTQYVPGNDPELVMGLPPPPPGVSPQGAVGMGPPMPDAPSAQPMGPPVPPPPIEIESEQGPMQLDMTGSLSPLTRGLNALGNTFAGAPNADSSQPGLGNMLGDAASSLGTALSPASAAPQAPAPQAPPPVTIQSEQGPMTIEPTGTIRPGDGGVPFEQLQQQMGGAGAGGMVPVQREGALPQDVAARQMSEMQGMNQQTLLATEQARRDESKIYGELVLKQMAANEAERVKREQDLADQQGRAERLQTEMQRVNNGQLDQSVRGAMGDVSGTLGIIGAMLQGAAGNDQGWRWLDKNVDRFVNDQVRRKGTELSMLAEQLGSTQQAITAGKASLYKVSADRLELLAQKAKGDVYEAQTPAVLQQLRQKQMEETQKFEQLSLGKTLEKAPLPPKPPTPEQMQEYGKLRRDRDAGVNIGQRVEQQLGLIWEPGQRGQPGQYRNKAEVLGKGIQGIGNLEQWVPDAVYSTMGGMTAEGYQVRGAAEAMAYATIRQMQPIGPISNADIKAAVKAGALDTEQGMVAALERIRTSAEEQQMSDAAQFSPQVVAEYERIRQAGGGVPLGQAPAAARPATTAEKRAGAGAQRTPTPQETEARGPGNLPPPTPEEFRNSVQGFAEGAGLNPDAVLRVIGHESGGKPGVTNKLTGKHAGLIQFSQETWKGLAKEAGTPELSWEDMRKMSAEEQLPYVMMYFNRVGLGPNNDPGDYAMAAFMPAYWNKPDDFVLGLKDSRESIGGLSMHKVWAQNPGLRNGDKITVGDVRRSVGS